MFSEFDGPDACCIMLSNRPTFLASLSVILEDNEVEFGVVADYTKLEDALALDTKINFVMIDLDSYPSVRAQSPSLRRLRTIYRDKRVILLSANFETDDFGMQREMLGDVLLRFPVLHASLEIAFLQAPVNNLEWRACERSST